MLSPRSRATLLSLFALVAGSGCLSERYSEPDPDFEFGDMLAPFDAPALAELDADAGWIDRPVRDALDVMRGLIADRVVELTAEEALALRNDSPEANAKLLASLGRLAPADGVGVDYGASVVRHVAGDLKSTNPLLISSVTEFDYHGLTSIGLVTFDKNFEWFGVSDVIESWQTSEDRLVDKFVLRDDLYWSDGVRVTAHDFAYTFKTIMTQAVIVPAVRQGTDELKAVVAYDDRTLAYFHKAALPINTENLSFAPIPKHVYEETIPRDPFMSRSPAHSRLEDNPVVAGPYELVKRLRGREFVLRRREGYHRVVGEEVRDRPYFEEVRVKVIDDINTALLALKQGDIDQMELRPEQWANQTGGDDFYRLNTKLTDQEWVGFHFVWNTQSPLFSDPRTRWAMTYAMDYEELLQTICYGIYQQSRGTFHPDSWMFPADAPEVVRQDLDRAAGLLAEAGWEDTNNDGVREKEFGGRRVPFQFTLLANSGSDTAKAACTLMKECLDRIGVRCNVKSAEFTTLTQKLRDKEFQAAMGGWGTGTDPYTIENIFGSGGGRNYGSYANQEVDELFERGMRELNREERAAIYARIHTLLWEDQPYTWLFYRNSFYAFNKRLRGYNFSPRGPFNYSPGFGSVYAPAATP